MEAEAAAGSDPVEAAYAYARSYYTNTQEVIDDYELLSRYRPETFIGYITLRQAAFNTGPDAALTRRMKELVILAIEFARTKVNEPPTGHARWAIEAGATPAEITEVASLAILIAGMLTYRQSAREALGAAVEHFASLHSDTTTASEESP